MCCDLHSADAGSVGLDWTGLDWTGLDWTGLTKRWGIVGNYTLSEPFSPPLTMACSLWLKCIQSWWTATNTGSCCQKRLRAVPPSGIVVRGARRTCESRLLRGNTTHTPQVSRRSLFPRVCMFFSPDYPKQWIIQFRKEPRSFIWAAFNSWMKGHLSKVLQEKCDVSGNECPQSFFI